MGLMEEERKAGYKFQLRQDGEKSCKDIRTKNFGCLYRSNFMMSFSVSRNSLCLNYFFFALEFTAMMH